MKSLTILSLLLATATVIQAQENLMLSYLKYLMPYVQPCAEELNLSEDEVRSIQMVPKEDNMEVLGCLRSCVMKQMGAMVDNKIVLGPLNTMIETVHEGKPDEIENVKKIASDCIADAESEGAECKIGLKYADCYMQKLFVNR